MEKEKEKEMEDEVGKGGNNLREALCGRAIRGR